MSTTSTAKDPALSKPAGITSISLGKKYFVAVSGAVLLLYVIGHMLGNLQIYIGQDQINMYAEKLHSLGPILWVIRAVLGILAILHIWFAIKLKLENVSARPISYAQKNWVEASLASRTMIWSGLLIFAFIAYHLAQFTLHWTNPNYTRLIDMEGRMDVYSMIIFGFKNYIISGFYIIMMFLLMVHLSHGVESMFQSVGWNSAKWQPRLHKIAWIVAVVLFLGFISIPISILLGFIQLPPGVTL